MKERKIFLVLFIGVMMLAACSGSATTTASAPFVGPVWQWNATTFAAGSIDQVPDPSLYTIHFNGDGTYSGNADCNSISGTYAVNGNKLQIKPGASTLMACPPGSLDTQFTTQLYSATDWATQDGANSAPSNLSITVSANSANMIFRSSIAPPVTVIP